MEFLQDSSYAMWLGLSLGIAGITWKDWRFYLVMLPTVALEVWKAAA